MQPQNIHELGIRRQGILICFNSYKAKHGRYPSTPDELAEVTSTILQDHQFAKYKRWFHAFTGEAQT